MYRFLSGIAILLVLANLAKAFAFHLSPLRLTESRSVRSYLMKRRYQNFESIQKLSTLTQPNHRPDTSFLRYKDKEFIDGAEEINANTKIHQDVSSSDTVTGTANPISVTESPASPGTVASTTTVPPEAPKKKSRVTRVIRSTSSGDTNKVRMIISLDEFDSCKEECEKNGRLMIVRFFSHWCKSCKAVEPYYKRLARKNPQVTFLDIPISKDNEEVRDALNIVSVPYGHIYHPTVGLMEELNMGKRFWSDFEDVFHRYTKGSCDLDVKDFYFMDPIKKRKIANF